MQDHTQASTTCATLHCPPAAVDVYLDDPTSRAMHARFGYCFQSPPGSEYPPIVTEHRLLPAKRSRSTAGRPITAVPILQEHGDIPSLGSASRAGLFLRPQPPAGPERRGAGRVEVWIVDALRYRPHPSHFSVDDALAWIERIKPGRAILTNLHSDLDYEELRAKLPPMSSPPSMG